MNEEEEESEEEDDDGFSGQKKKEEVEEDPVERKIQKFYQDFVDVLKSLSLHQYQYVTCFKSMIQLWLRGKSVGREAA